MQRDELSGLTACPRKRQNTKQKKRIEEKLHFQNTRKFNILLPSNNSNESHSYQLMIGAHRLFGAFLRDPYGSKIQSVVHEKGVQGMYRLPVFYQETASSQSVAVGVCVWRRICFFYIKSIVRRQSRTRLY